MSNLLQINSVVNFGSTGHIADEIGQLAISNGWNSHIAYGRHKRSSQSELIKIGNDIDFKIHVLQTRIFDRHGLASNYATQKLIEKIKEIKPDIIHLHNLHGYYLNIIDLFKYLHIARIPIVWTLHDCWPITGHCTFFDYIKCEKWVSLCSQCPQKKKYPASYFFDRSKGNFILKKELFTSVDNMTIVPVSNWLSNIVKKSYLSKYQIKVINNGVDTSFFGGFRNTLIKNKFNFDNKFIILGVANIWDARKGLWDFVELSKLIDQNCLIVLVGLNSKEIRNLPRNIIGIARTESMKELAELYTCADVFINPTYEDNFPTTNLEALASGTPVITYNTGGSIEAVSPETGYVVEKGDIAHLIKTINICQALGKENFTAACVDRADKLYKKDDRYKDYLNLYAQLLKQ